MSTTISIGRAGDVLVIPSPSLNSNQAIMWGAHFGREYPCSIKKKIRRTARKYWAKHMKKSNINIKVFTQKTEQFYNEEDMPQKTACLKARNVLCYEQQLKDVLK